MKRVDYISKYSDKLVTIRNNESINYLIANQSNIRSKLETIDNNLKLLSDFIKIQNDLIFIGFLGHFSSGKSSLINSLLIHCGADKNNCRPTGENPTDKDITLIATTYEDHEKIKGLSNLYSWIEPVLWIVPDNFFKGKIIIDTPGLGNYENEKVRNFFYICDLIALVVNSRSPFGSTKENFSFLKVKFEELSHIPSFFVFTNMDHFLIDRRAEYNNGGLDENHIHRFLNETFLRIENDSGISDRIMIDLIKNNDRFFVDNKDNYKIDEVVDFIKSYEQNEYNESIIAADRDLYIGNLFNDMISDLKGHLSTKHLYLDKILKESETNKTTAFDALDGELRLFKDRTDEIVKNLKSFSQINFQPDSSCSKYKELLEAKFKSLPKILERYIDTIKSVKLSADAKLLDHADSQKLDAHSINSEFINGIISESINAKIQDINTDEFKSFILRCYNEKLSDLGQYYYDELNMMRRKLNTNTTVFTNRIEKINEALDDLLNNYENHILQYLRYVYSFSNKKIFKEFGNSFLENTENDFLSFKIQREAFMPKNETHKILEEVNNAKEQHKTALNLQLQNFKERFLSDDNDSFFEPNNYIKSKDHHELFLKILLGDDPHKKKETENEIINTLISKNEEYKERKKIVKQSFMFFPLILILTYFIFVYLNSENFVELSTVESFIFSAILSPIFLFPTFLTSKIKRALIFDFVQTLLGPKKKELVGEIIPDKFTDQSSKLIIINEYFFNKIVKHEIKSKISNYQIVAQEISQIWDQFPKLSEKQIFSYTEKILKGIGLFLRAQRKEAIETPYKEIESLRNTVGEAYVLIKDMNLTFEWNLREDKNILRTKNIERSE